LGATKDTAAKVKNLVGEHKAALALHHGDRASEGDVRRLAARLHPASAEELAHVMHASHPSGSSPAGNWLTQKAKEHEVHEGPTKPLLTGKHMMELGMKPGKEVGAIIKRVLELQMDGHVKTVEDAKEAARGMIPKTISASLDGTPSLFERIVGRSLWEAIDFAGDLDRAMKKHGPAHPNTTKALKVAAANMERLPVEAQKRVRLALALTVGREVRSDLSRGTRWQQTAGVDFDLKRALIEGLSRSRGRSGPRAPHLYASYLPHESDPLDHEDPLLGRHVFSNENDRNSFMKGARAHYAVEQRPSAGGRHIAMVTHKKHRDYDDTERAAIYGPPRNLRRIT
jgi:hypothetical protein